MHCECGVYRYFRSEVRPIRYRLHSPLWLCVFVIHRFTTLKVGGGAGRTISTQRHEDRKAQRGTYSKRQVPRRSCSWKYVANCGRRSSLSMLEHNSTKPDVTPPTFFAPPPSTPNLS